MEMLLYHGSNIEVKEPQLIGQARGLDFGAGFYLTTSENQAQRFSEIVVARRKRGIAIVSVFDFDMEMAASSLSIRKFERADAEWLKFVADNRMKAYRGGDFDVVIGAVANDIVMPTIQAFLGGFLSEEATLAELKKGNLLDQFCLKTDRAIAMLSFVRAYEHKDGK
jgi:hypothetical protein